MILETVCFLGRRATAFCICKSMNPTNGIMGAVHSLAHYVYLKVGESSRLHTISEQMEQDTALWGSTLYSAVFPRIAFLCDEMTWQDFRPQCNGIFLHPLTWREQMERFRPELFFCEAAWSGIRQYDGVWRGRVYQDHRLLFDNRGILLDVLSYCRAQEIPTVFWAKEDPVFFHHPVYDFTQTALLFDGIFTTAAECMQQYRALGHPNVFLLPFGVDTERFHPDGYNPEVGSAVFAGSWFGDQEERCQALERLFEYSMNLGLRLDIYDRKYYEGKKRFQFPAKYRPYCHPPVAYEDTPELFHRYEYAINVNTVTDSPTMCSRRLLQLAASGNTIISNAATALSTLSDVLEIQPSDEPGIVFVRSRTGQIEERYSIKRQFSDVIAQVGSAAGKREQVLNGAEMVETK